MSLKAKIEAVIYAAEEPVTLTQLASAFAAEVPFPATEFPAETPAQTIDADITSIDSAGGMHEVIPNDPAREATVEAPPVTINLPTPDTETQPTAEASCATGLEAATRRAARQRERDIRDFLRAIVDELVADYALQDRGVEIREIAGGFRMATKPEYHDAVRAFVKNLKPPMKLSLQALETLAVIAYKQPVTAPEVAEIRGVDSGGVLASLISRKLVTTAGRKQVVGRPILYKTTRDFLLRFGLKDIGELPSMEEFEKMAGELNEEASEEAPVADNKPSPDQGETTIASAPTGDNPEPQLAAVSEESADG